MRNSTITECIRINWELVMLALVKIFIKMVTPLFITAILDYFEFSCACSGKMFD